MKVPPKSYYVQVLKGYLFDGDSKTPRINSFRGLQHTLEVAEVAHGKKFVTYLIQRFHIGELKK